MDQIVLDLNLKYVCAALNLSQRGELLSALFEGKYDGDDDAVFNVFCYIDDLQKKYASRKQKMHALSLKSAAVRRARSADGELPLELPDEQTLIKRKEAKEKDDINKNNLLFSGSVNQKFFKKNNFKPKSPFVPPTITEVRDFIRKNQLKADAETFINFYESHGWMVGSTPIKSWQATLKLWHARNTASPLKPDIDEDYWNQLSGRVHQDQDCQHIQTENDHE